MPLREAKQKALMGQLSVSLLVLTSFTAPCDAFFRNLMIGDTAMARVDPVVNSGEPAVHVHHLTGGSSKYNAVSISPQN